MMVQTVVIKESETNVIVDAIKVEASAGLKRATIKKFSQIWAPMKYHIESIIAEDPNRHFSGREIRTINEITQGSKVEPHEFLYIINSSIEKTVKWAQQRTMKSIRDYLGFGALVTGEANTMIYNEDLYEAFMETYEKTGLLPDDKKTIFIAGPILVVEDKHINDKINGSIVPRLQKHPNCIVYCSNHRQEIHVRVGADIGVYIEEAHGALATKRRSWCFENDPNLAKKYRRMIQSLINNGEVKKSEKSDDFLFLTRSELEKLKRAVNREIKKGNIVSYDECTKDDFLEIIEKHNITGSLKKGTFKPPQQSGQPCVFG